MLIKDNLEKKEKHNEITKNTFLSTPFPMKLPGNGWIDESRVQKRGLGWLDIQIGSPQQISEN